MKVYQLMAAAALLVAPTVGFGATIVGDAADLFVAGPFNTEYDGSGVNPPPSSGNPSGATLKVGIADANPLDTAAGGRVPILVFQLPDLGAVANPFTSADFGIGFGVRNGSTAFNVDVYGLSRRNASPTFDFVNDYYIGGNLDTTNATKIQDNLATPSSTVGTNAAPVVISTDSVGDAALLAFLNSQYAGGNGANQYVYLRLSTDAPYGGTGGRGYNIATGNNGTASVRPTITYDVIPEPSSAALLGLGGLALARRRRRA